MAAYAVSLATYRDAVDDITASFEPMEADDAVEETVVARRICAESLGKRRRRLGL